ncbi:hypothetical protein PC128_g21084 [Phytophthora cactorum]|nr:hypothetical protein PC128_g21084 [Phytophthora cactorum]
MEAELTPWGLFDLSGALNPDTPDTMRDHFRRFRAARQKTIEGADLEALRRSWCAFIRRWNRMSERVLSAGWRTARRSSRIIHSRSCASASAKTPGMKIGSAS